MVATFLSDTFTDTDNVTLQNHTGETGATWATTSGTLTVTANRVWSTNNPGRYYASGTPGSADYSVTAIVRVITLSITGWTMVCGRMATDSDTQYVAALRRASPGGGTWSLEVSKFVTGTSTLLGSTTVTTPSANSDHTLTLTMVGDQISGTYDGTTIGPYTDSGITTAGKAGLRPFNNSAGSTTGVHYDSITATDYVFPKIETLTDSFTTEDSTKWDNWADSNVAVVNHAAQFTCTSGYPYLLTQNWYSLQGSAVFCEVAQRPNVGNGTTDLYLEVYVAEQNSAYMQVQNNSLYFGETVNNTPNATSITYNATDHRWWRVRESAGTIYWDTSPDGNTWTNRRNKAVGLYYGRIRCRFLCGYYGTEPDPGVAIIDNLNVHVAPFGGSGTLSATAESTGGVERDADFSGVGALTAAVVEREKATAALSGVGALTAVVVEREKATATLAGSGSLTAAVSASMSAAAEFAGTGALSATARAHQIATLAGVGVLTAAVVEREAAAAALAGSGSLTATVVEREVTAATLAGSGSLTAATNASMSCSATLSGTGALSATAQMYQIAAAVSLSGTGALSATAMSSSGATPQFAGAGVLSATAQMYRIASSVELAGTGTLTTTAKPRFSRPTSAAGQGTLSATAQIYQLRTTVVLSGAGTLSVAAIPKLSRDAPLTGSGALSATAQLYQIQSAAALAC